MSASNGAVKVLAYADPVENGFAGCLVSAETGDVVWRGGLPPCLDPQEALGVAARTAGAQGYALAYLDQYARVREADLGTGCGGAFTIARCSNESLEVAALRVFGCEVTLSDFGAIKRVVVGRNPEDPTVPYYVVSRNRETALFAVFDLRESPEPICELVDSDIPPEKLIETVKKCIGRRPAYSKSN